jgi:DNA-binding response OmpR family regulator
MNHFDRGGKAVNMGKKVLVIEDNPMISDFLCELLRTKGYQSSCCLEGETALKTAEEMHPDIVLIDYRLPGMNGAEIAKRLRLRRPKTLIIGMSSESIEYVFRAAGADCFVQKPFSVRSLVSIITGSSSSDG